MINKRGKNEEKLSDTLGSYVKQDNIKSRYHEVGINKIWQELMGEMVNNYTKSISYTYLAINCSFTA